MNVLTVQASFPESNAECENAETCGAPNVQRLDTHMAFAATIPFYSFSITMSVGVFNITAGIRKAGDSEGVLVPLEDSDSIVLRSRLLNLDGLTNIQTLQSYGALNTG